MCVCVCVFNMVTWILTTHQNLASVDHGYMLIAFILKGSFQTNKSNQKAHFKIRRILLIHRLYFQKRISCRNLTWALSSLKINENAS